MRIPKTYNIYSTKIAGVKFSLIAHEVHGVIIDSPNFYCRAELMHSSIVELKEGRCLVRFRNESVMNIASFTENEIKQLKNEFALLSYKNEFEAPFTNTYSNFKVSSNEISRWSKRHPRIAKRIRVSPYINTSIFDFCHSTSKNMEYRG
ncbi:MULTISPECIES: hypothetical protein [unclassified Pseudoalteromonas]|uniref:hypothetical protein n=1 Tax=unclassified Pseudoalteromonas TaxID=194690 RepID=UPI002359D4D6|nr:MULTISPECIES: hypothetical protein [unclassified Pseudoalteromonas]MDC9563383.1 hypothetical protein [Pseudoalteromonas sp. GAB2316C]MDC9572135.1 hypothetical protein [Pseudoalteromonas sp. GABNS16A]MDC9583830.1 hypothetical protein [Pseudoalteromonas sp. GABNS16C]MDC9607774.1 hypothetical protein [Pseudoalteromonas sp. GABNS16H]